MASLPWGQLITAVLVAFVVFASLKAGGGIAEAANKVTSIVGVELVQPSIKSFTATPESSGNIQFQLSLGGSPDNVELLIYQRYAPTPDVELGAPDFKKENIVFDLISSSEATGQKLIGQLEKGVVNVACPKDATAVGENGCESLSPYKLGGYRFVAVLKRGKVVDSRDTVTGSYDENYVEMLHTPVFGCEDFNFHDCNVVECKKKVINTNLLNSFDSPSRVRRESGVLRSISSEFRAEKGFGSSNDCGKVGNLVGKAIDNDKEISALHLLTAGCSDKDVDDLNIKVARARLLEVAFDGGVNSEDKYVTDLARLDFWRERAVEMTMSCTVPLGGPDPRSHWPNAPFGAYTALAKLNWQFAPSDSTPKLWKGMVNAELDRVLNSKLKPVIMNIRADAFDDRHLSIEWEIPLGENKVKAGNYKISHFHKRWERGVTTENQKVLQSETVVAGQKGDGEVLTSFDIAAGQLTGRHEFEVRILGSNGNELAIAKAATGMFDDAYIETYKGWIDGCVTKGLGKDMKGLHECDVYGQKREELKALATPAGDKQKARVKAAQSESSVKSSCKYEIVNEAGDLFIPHYAFNGCEPEELDRIWKSYLKSLGSADDYDCVLPLRSDAKNVCIIKRQVVNTLAEKGWKDLRVNKGWEANV